VDGKSSALLQSHFLVILEHVKQPRSIPYHPKFLNISRKSCITFDCPAPAFAPSSTPPLTPTAPVARAVTVLVAETVLVA
jgi:hypothetical protein